MVAGLAGGQGLLRIVIFKFGLGLAFLRSGIPSLSLAKALAAQQVSAYERLQREQLGRIGAVCAGLRYPKHRWARGHGSAWQVRVAGVMGDLIGLALIHTACAAAQSSHLFAA